MNVGMDFTRWSIIASNRVASGPVTNSFRVAVRIPEATFFNSYAVRIVAWVGGTITVKIRHTLSTASTSAQSIGPGFYGLDFLPISGLNAFDVGSIGYGIAAANPAQVGNELSPREPAFLRGYITTPPAGLNNMTWQLLGARFGVT